MEDGARPLTKKVTHSIREIRRGKRMIPIFSKDVRRVIRECAIMSKTPEKEGGFGPGRGKEKEVGIN